MRFRSAFLTAIFLLIASNAQSLSLTRIEHTIRNASSHEIAAMVSQINFKKDKVERVKELSYLLRKPKEKTKFHSSVDSHDILILMLSKVTDIRISDKDESAVKAIISYQNADGKIYRYHLADFSKKEKKIFVKKVKNWILVNSKV